MLFFMLSCNTHTRHTLWGSSIELSSFLEGGGSKSSRLSALQILASHIFRHHPQSKSLDPHLVDCLHFILLMHFNLLFHAIITPPSIILALKNVFWLSLLTLVTNLTIYFTYIDLWHYVYYIVFISSMPSEQPPKVQSSVPTCHINPLNQPKPIGGPLFDPTNPYYLGE